MIKLTIEQQLEQNGHGFFQTVGDSMEPLLHNRKSTVVIEKKKTQLNKYDVVLFKRTTGEYVLHRVVRILQDAYLICGDNCVEREKVEEEWILGVMIGFYEDERNIFTSCTSKSYIGYLKTLKIRAIILRLRNLINIISFRLGIK